MNVMKINKLLLLSVLPALGILSSCEDMDENYKDYTTEVVFSGKITNLKSLIGYQSVILYWDNPIDQRSKGIEIECIGADTTVFKYDLTELNSNSNDLEVYKADSVRIKGLTEGTGYDFTVYSTDAYGNRSIAVSTTVLPLSSSAVESIIPPTCATEIDADGNTALNFTNISTMSIRFAGKIVYQIFDENGNAISDQLTETVEVGDSKKGTRYTEWLVSYPGLNVNTPYTVKFKTDVWPLSGTSITEDIITMESEAKITYRINNLSNLSYTAGKDYVILKWGQTKNALTKNIVITYGDQTITHPYDISKTTDEEKIVLTENKAVTFTLAREDADGLLSRTSTINATPITQAFVDAISDPKMEQSENVLGQPELKFSKVGNSSQYNLVATDNMSEFTYEVTEADGTPVPGMSGTLNISSTIQEFILPASTLERGKDYKITYSFDCYPKVSGKVSLDVFTVTRTKDINFETVE